MLILPVEPRNDNLTMLIEWQSYFIIVFSRDFVISTPFDNPETISSQTILVELLCFLLLFKVHKISILCLN